MDPRARLQKQLVDMLRTSLAGGKVALPEAGRLLWSWFLELHGGRQHGPAGPQPLASSEIEAWARMSGWTLDSGHRAALRAMDAAYLEHAHAMSKKVREGVKVIPNRAKQPVSTAAFDAVFG